MSESATGTEGAATPPEGSAPASSAAGGVPEGYVPRSELDQIEARRRSLQSELDRTKAELDTARKPAPTTESAPAASTLDPNAFADVVMARINQERSMEAAREKLSQEFPLAHPTVLQAKHQTPEELAAAVQESHTTAKALHDRIAGETRTALLAEIKERHGLDLGPAPQTTSSEGEGGGKSEPNVVDLARMPFSEFVKLDPKVTEAALRS